MSARPTILLYPADIYERHPSASALLEELRAARIVFEEPRAAAAHISAVWSDLDGWWNRADVVRARTSFSQMAMKFDDRWLGEWTGVLSELMRATASSTPATS
jgi:putative transferase (TIGR04331 family)